MNPREQHAPSPPRLRALRWTWLLVFILLPPLSVKATPANKAALEKHYNRFLSKELSRCTTCHLPSDQKAPENLDQFPHNPFGHRLRLLGEQHGSAAGKDIAAKLARVAREDADGDGVDNETELLLGTNPGEAKSTPAKAELIGAQSTRAEFAKYLEAYRWQPFEPVKRPAVPAVKNRRWVQNPVDAFLASEHEAHELKPRPEAPKEVLLRRLYLDLLGLSPTPAEQRAFAADGSANAYQELVNRLLDDPRYGERWGRHWMDVWRYSDWAGWTDGGQVRDSKPHVWRWRDWIVESLNADKPYDRMILEMLAADELAPEDTDALRATGFLVRNYKMLSREQWLEDTVKHTSQAFLGITVGCAKCHDHMTDPISQKEYYQVRAIFEPHQVRTDRVPGQTNTVQDGLVRAFDVGTNPPTWLFHRGDERHPDTNHLIVPGVPAALGGKLEIDPVPLPRLAASPDKREFVIEDSIAASEKALASARDELQKLRTNSAAKPGKLKEQELTVGVLEARHHAFLPTIRAEQLEDAGKKMSGEWKEAATEASRAQLVLAAAEAKLKLHLAQIARTDAQSKADEAAVKTNNVEKTTKDLEAAKKKADEAEESLATAERALQAVANTTYQPRSIQTYPSISTGRRLAFARWIAARNNPLTARVAMNHIWLRHFGRGLVPTAADFGRNGRPPSHPQLLDWLASEFMEQNWSMKTMHRLIVTSSAYRMASTSDELNARKDPDNVYLWRMNSRRLEAEVVRDNLLFVTGGLDLTRGGPDIDHKLGLTSKRRSLYLRLAAEKDVEFLKIFDGPSVTECYERKPSVVPQQALALANSELALAQARVLASTLSSDAGEGGTGFILQAFRRVLARRPSPDELRLCQNFLTRPSPTNTVPISAKTDPGKPSSDPIQRARENLILVLLNHNDFVTVR
jgi:hypothetical protein